MQVRVMYAYMYVLILTYMYMYTCANAYHGTSRKGTLTKQGQPLCKVSNSNLVHSFGQRNAISGRPHVITVFRHERSVVLLTVFGRGLQGELSRILLTKMFKINNGEMHPQMSTK